MKQRLFRSLLKHLGPNQFGNPHGALGRVAGWVMGRRSSTVRRSRWAVELLDLQPADRQSRTGVIRVATVVEPGGSTIGVIENPNFVLPPDAGSAQADGPGR